jgi:hypothetical protein
VRTADLFEDAPAAGSGVAVKIFGIEPAGFGNLDKLGALR